MSEPNHQRPETAAAKGTALRRLLFLSPLAVFVVVAGVFLWGLDPGRDPRFIPTAMLEKPVPTFDYPAVEGIDRPGFATADLTGKGVTLVNFFASWCVPCRIEHPLLTDLATSPGVRLFGISHRDKPADTARFLEQLGNPYDRIGSDPGRGAIEWGVYGLPETFIIDDAGQIRFHHRGPLTKATIETEMQPILEALR